METEKRLNIMDPDALFGFSAARMLCCLRYHIGRLQETLPDFFI